MDYLNDNICYCLQEEKKVDFNFLIDHIFIQKLSHKKKIKDIENYFSIIGV